MQIVNAHLRPSTAKVSFLTNSVQIIAIAELPPEDRACNICYEGFREVDGRGYHECAIEHHGSPEPPIRIACCGHIFGQHCLTAHVHGAFAHSNSCPMCRALLFTQPNNINAIVTWYLFARIAVFRRGISIQQAAVVSVSEAFELARTTRDRQRADGTQVMETILADIAQIEQQTDDLVEEGKQLWIDLDSNIGEYSEGDERGQPLEVTKMRPVPTKLK
jgi:hypothetical protein